MAYLVFWLLPPIVAITVLVVAIKKGFNKQAFVVSAGVTMLISMFTMHNATWYGFICTLTIPLAGIYVAICLGLSIKERRGGGE